jgi:SWI/SNF-related matrix-associated actin-dependent regulator 1 of chromatin subfamily A
MFLYPFQVTGVNEMLNWPSAHIYNADVMGIGKTIQGLVFANMIGAHRLLVVCLASLRLNWLREANIWFSLTKNSGHAIVTGEDLYAIERKLWRDKGFMPSPLIVSYEMIVRNKALYKYIKKREWDLMILDEAHVIRTPTTQTAGKIIDIWQNNCARVLPLSGTPMQNSGADFFTPLSQIVPPLDYLDETTRDLCSDFNAFTGQFCYRFNGRFGVRYRGVRNADQLKRLLRVDGKFFTRRSKEEVKLDLPPKTHSRVDIGLKNISGRYLTTEELDGIIDAVKRQDTGKIKKVEKAHGTMWRELGEAVAAHKDSIEFISSILEDDRPLVLFYFHTAVCNILKKILAKKFPDKVIVTHNGLTTAANKELAVRDFQAGRADIFIAQVRAAAGYTVTRASDAVFVEFDLLSTNNEQAADRLHRIGQQNPCNYWWLIADDPFARKLAKLMIQKDKNIQKVLGDEESLESTEKVSFRKRKTSRKRRRFIDTAELNLRKEKMLEILGD